jgi:hypothetical protein
MLRLAIESGLTALFSIPARERSWRAMSGYCTTLSAATQLRFTPSCIRIIVGGRVSLERLGTTSVFFFCWFWMTTDSLVYWQEDKKTRRLVADALNSQIDWRKHPFVKTYNLIHAN